jgi:hypothetical protein
MNARIFLLGLLFLTCERNTPFYDAPDELDSYVQLFVHEGSKRGVHIDPAREGLQVIFGKVKGNHHGSCKPNNYPKVVTIDSVKWKYISPPHRELLLFHELAHCLLEKQHNDDTFPFGECKSWMRADQSKCKPNVMNAAWRKYYIDEIFSKEPPTPPWYDAKHSLPMIGRPAGKTINIQRGSFTLFDSMLVNTKDDWMLRVGYSKPRQLPAAIGISINEIMVECYYFSDPSNGQELFLSEVILMDSGLGIPRQPHLIYKNNRAVANTTTITFEKQGDVVFIFFDADLRLCLPIDGELRMGGYSTFGEGEYGVVIYGAESSL